MRKSRFNHQFCTKTCFNHQYCTKINYFFIIQCFIHCFVANTYTKGGSSLLRGQNDFGDDQKWNLRKQKNYFWVTTNDLEFEGTKQLFVGDYKRNLRDRTMILGGPKATITPLWSPQIPLVPQPWLLWLLILRTGVYIPVLRSILFHGQENSIHTLLIIPESFLFEKFLLRGEVVKNLIYKKFLQSGR